LGSARIVQDGTSPVLKKPTRFKPATHWSLYSRMHSRFLRMAHVSQRHFAELLAFFGPGTYVLQTDFPKAYKSCWLTLDSLFAHFSCITTKEHGTEFWGDLAQIFGSSGAPPAWELFILPFQHLIRRLSKLLSFTVHYVDNTFTFLAQHTNVLSLSRPWNS
jgi:hypothetical protein